MKKYVIKRMENRALCVNGRLLRVGYIVTEGEVAQAKALTRIGRKRGGRSWAIFDVEEIKAGAKKITKTRKEK